MLCCPTKHAASQTETTVARQIQTSHPFVSCSLYRLLMFIYMVTVLTGKGKHKHKTSLPPFSLKTAELCVGFLSTQINLTKPKGVPDVPCQLSEIKGKGRRRGEE